ncbi:TetR/AcrR family transcriptional regulator [Corynebacterium guangdongense]|uniref:AcrR family transcriptional regulator n=1 Tax=Corynebacterium guangdongense TaxID=1783348 RepID=A0ABU1ZYN9_9CORY|nr:TetR/AcrR family transcriptional regulator [Corynebacterium guangdongense]MDR7330053.1 AcrR family transcriptional regulator [Corynebacterium guangdongense]WJZ18611.1 HTH-type transcriptional repressor NicS [Corynebacterium guangdongense]
MSNQESGIPQESAQFTASGATPPADSAAARVTSVALDYFAEYGYEGTKLESIARDAGMSKRMIHYHFGDKRGLYEQALIAAINRLHPLQDAFLVESDVPVEGMRVLVDALFAQFLQHPEAVRMIVMENLTQVLDIASLPPLSDESTIKLHVDRLLLAGQDAGAFRPGISADDIFTLVASLAFYRVTNTRTTANLFNIHLDSEENVEGVHRMMIDSVLAFLTSNIPNTGQASYLVADNVSLGREDSSADGGLYDPSSTADLFDEPYE